MSVLFPKAMPVFHSPSYVSFALLPRFLLKMILLYLQVFGEGTDAVKKSLEGIFDDTVPDGKVKINMCSHSKSTTMLQHMYDSLVSWDTQVKWTQ